MHVKGLLGVLRRARVADALAWLPLMCEKDVYCPVTWQGLCTSFPPSSAGLWEDGVVPPQGEEMGVLVNSGHCYRVFPLERG